MKFLLPLSNCPNCGQPRNAACEAELETAPKPGDIALCFDCGTVLELGPLLELRLASVDAIRSLSPDATRRLAGMQTNVLERLEGT